MKMFVMAAALAVVAGAAFAGEGNGDPFPFQAPTHPVSLNNYKQAASASQNPFPFTVPGTASVADQVLPTNGSNGVVQTANSLPPGFEDGVPGQANLNPGTRMPTRLAQPSITSVPRG